jgi:carbamoyltransferase
MPDEEIVERHQDLAAALQKITNEIQLSLARYLHRVTGLKHLCQAGGVALNCIANRTILEEGPFENVFIPPAANDAGTALGAAYYLWNHEMGQPRTARLDHVYLGPDFDAIAVKERLFPAARKSRDVAKEVAELLARGEIIAWFQGRMELGPRALGARSILADPRRSDMVHLLNDKIKHREFFRPFGASVLTEKSATGSNSRSVPGAMRSCSIHARFSRTSWGRFLPSPTLTARAGFNAWTRKPIRDSIGSSGSSMRLPASRWSSTRP